MLGTTRNIRVYVYGKPVDMRKGYNGLYGLVVEEMGLSVMSGDIFLFVGRDRKRAKALVWDGTGLVLYCKRLERGLFASFWGRKASRKELTMSELQLFLEGSQEVSQRRLAPKRYLHNFVD